MRVRHRHVPANKHMDAFFRLYTSKPQHADENKDD